MISDSQIVNKEETSKQEIADVLSIGQYFQWVVIIYIYGRWDNYL